jgi:hypothetical protein
MLTGGRLRISGPRSSCRSGARVCRRIACLLLAAELGGAGPAQAQSTIGHPEDRAPYTVELEPHVVAAPFNPPGSGSGAGFGAGARASIEIVHTGFVPSINNSVAIGVGVDFLHYQGSGVLFPGACVRRVPGPGGTSVCAEVSPSGASSNYAFLPLTLQWNFWLTRQWSVFGEPGLTLYWFDYRSLGASPALYLGGRFHFTDAITLTVRIGYPILSIGVSFLL